MASFLQKHLRGIGPFRVIISSGYKLPACDNETPVNEGLPKLTGKEKRPGGREAGKEDTQNTNS